MSRGVLFDVAEAGGRTCTGFGHFSSCGLVCMVVPNGTLSQESTLYAFCALRKCTDGAVSLSAVVLDTQGNIFGTTEVGGTQRWAGSGGGVVFELSGSNYQVVHKFCTQKNCPNGSYPNSIIRDNSGHFFGTTIGGGNSNDGTIFEMFP
jgi:hypothetical protein